MNYTEKRLSPGKLKQLLRNAGLRPQEVLRTNEDAYRRHAAGKNLSDDELLHIMSEYPEMLQTHCGKIRDKGQRSLMWRNAEGATGHLTVSKTFARSRQ